MWFQQDSIASHIANVTMEILHLQFLDMVKQQVYANLPQMTDVIKAKITQVISQIQPNLCSRVFKIGPSEFEPPSIATAAFWMMLYSTDIGGLFK